MGLSGSLCFSITCKPQPVKTPSYLCNQSSYGKSENTTVLRAPTFGTNLSSDLFYHHCIPKLLCPCLVRHALASAFFSLTHLHSHPHRTSLFSPACFSPSVQRLSDHRHCNTYISFQTGCTARGKPCVIYTEKKNC